MVGDVELPCSPLVSASWILTGAVAAVHTALSILVRLGAYVIEVEPVATAWVVDDHVLKMRDTPKVSELGFCEIRESFVSDTGRTKVVAASGVTSFDQIKSCQRGKRCSQTVAGRLNFCGRMLSAQVSDLVQNLRKCALLSIVETFVNFAVAFRERGVRSLCGGEIGDPVKD